VSGQRSGFRSVFIGPGLEREQADARKRRNHLSTTSADSGCRSESKKQRARSTAPAVPNVNGQVGKERGELRGYEAGEGGGEKVSSSE